MDNLNLELLKLLTAGNSLIDAGLIVAVGYLIKTIRDRLGLSTAVALIKGRIAELTETDKYALLAKIAKALLSEDGDTDEASRELAYRIGDYLDAKNAGGLKDNV